MNSTLKKILKKIEAEKNGDEDGKALYKSMNNAIYGKLWKTREIKSRCKTHKQQKRLFKIYIKTKLYFAENIWQ